MTFEQFLARLDKRNPFFPIFIDDLVRIGEAKFWEYAPKSNDLCEVVKKMCRKRNYPLVDKKLGVIICPKLGTHEMLRGLLWYYHKGTCNDRLEMSCYDIAAEKYMAEGMGYYMSTMQPGVINTSSTYRPDRYDKDLFLLFHTSTESF